MGWSIIFGAPNEFSKTRRAPSKCPVPVNVNAVLHLTKNPTKLNLVHISLVLSLKKAVVYTGLRVFTSVFAPTAYGHYITAGHKLLYVVVAGALFRSLGQAVALGG